MFYRLVLCINRRKLSQLLNQNSNSINLNTIKSLNFSGLIGSKVRPKCDKTSVELRLRPIGGLVSRAPIRQLKSGPSDSHRALLLKARSRNKDMVLYATAFVLAVLGGTYAAVPLYRIYCMATGKGGKPFIDETAGQKMLTMKKTEDRLITVTFSAETTSQMSWNFKPTQPQIKCYPGETVLAFFTAKNPLDRPVDGIATYSVQPFEAGSYLNKIQCFCFEEQRLNPQELVDLPVFFYIDPEYATDPKLENVNDIILSYTFFEAKKGMKLPTFFNATPAGQVVAADSTGV